MRHGSVSWCIWTRYTIIGEIMGDVSRATAEFCNLCLHRYKKQVESGRQRTACHANRPTQGCKWLRITLISVVLAPPSHLLILAVFIAGDGGITDYWTGRLESVVCWQPWFFLFVLFLTLAAAMSFRTPETPNPWVRFHANGWKLLILRATSDISTRNQWRMLKADTVDVFFLK